MRLFTANVTRYPPVGEPVAVSGEVCPPFKAARNEGAARGGAGT